MALNGFRSGGGDPFVRFLQMQLKAHGFDPGAVDGVMGNRTKAALIQFQRARGIEPSGMGTQATVGALRQAVMQPPMPRLRPDAPPVALQGSASIAGSQGMNVQAAPFQMMPSAPGMDATAGAPQATMVSPGPQTMPPSPGATAGGGMDQAPASAVLRPEPPPRWSPENFEAANRARQMSMLADDQDLDRRTSLSQQRNDNVFYGTGSPQYGRQDVNPETGNSPLASGIDSYSPDDLAAAIERRGAPPEGPTPAQKAAAAAELIRLLQARQQRFGQAFEGAGY
jgi:peptidoglycan hydrolase-like protein with peptidoglycan-binding domain